MIVKLSPSPTSYQIRLLLPQNNIFQNLSSTKNHTKPLTLFCFLHFFLLIKTQQKTKTTQSTQDHPRRPKAAQNPAVQSRLCGISHGTNLLWFDRACLRYPEPLRNHPWALGKWMTHQIVFFFDVGCWRHYKRWPLLSCWLLCDDCVGLLQFGALLFGFPFAPSLNLALDIRPTQ